MRTVKLFNHSVVLLFFYSIILLFSYPFISFAQTDIPEMADSITAASIYDLNPSSRWIRELKNIIVVSPRNETVADTFNIESPGNIYLFTEGMTINAIRIIRLKPFGTSITDIPDNASDDDFGTREVNWLGRASNAIHVNTSELVIRNALMFKEGDIIDGFKLAYSERYLRSLRYIGDARVNAVAVSDNEAEVIVVVQDIFPYSVNFNTNLSSQANFSITNRNIVGFGLEMMVGSFFDSKKDHLMGYQATVRSSNIGRSFVSFQADYLDKYENQRYGFALRRDFYSPDTKYAGHLMLYDTRISARYFTPGGLYPVFTPVSIRYKQFDAWLGRSFRISDETAFNKQYKNLTASLRMQYIFYLDRPEQSENYFYRFQNKTTYLAALTYSQQSFYKASLIYNFGRTEDIPYGDQISVIGGREVNEKYVRPYLGANYSTGYFIPRFGYLSGSFAYGTFFNNGATDQGIIDLQMNYFTNLYVLGNVRLRTFVNGQYTGQLYNRLEDQLIIDGDNGIPGFRNDSVLGRHRFNISAEQNFFMPREIYGFRFVLYTFAYLSWLGDYDQPIILSNLYSSFGVGVRIRNNRLVFNTIQIQFAYFPNIPKNSHFRYIHFSNETVLQPRDFMPKAPEIMPLN